MQSEQSLSLSKSHTRTNQMTLIAAAISATLCVPTMHVSAEEADAFEGETMVISGSRIEQKLEDTAGSVSVVTAEDINQFMMTDLKSLFRYEPGISTSGSGAQPQTLTVRGVGGNRLVYIKDGRRSNDGYAGGGGFIVGRGYFNTDTVQQIEVAKGAASSLYGSDGLGGIVVITTKDPEDYLQGDSYFLGAGLGYDGAADELRLDFTGAVETGKWALSAAVSHTDGSEVQNYQETLPGYESSSDALLFKAVRQLAAQQSLKFTLDIFEQEVDQVIIQGANETRDSDQSHAFSVDYHNENTTALWDSLDLQAYFSQYEQRSDQVLASTRGYTDYNDYRFEQDIWGLRAVFSKSFTSGAVSHQLVYGVDHDKYDTFRPRIKTRVLNDGSTEFSDEPQKAFPGADTSLTGVFMQDNISWTDSPWSMVVGGRVDFFDMQPKQDSLYDGDELKAIDETAFSPKVGFVLDASEQTALYVQYVEGFKIPPHDQAYQSHGVEPVYQILPNSDLESEESQTLEAGVRFNNNDLAMEINGFYSEFDNFIESTLIGIEDTFIPGLSKQLFQYQNIDQTRIKGIEMSVGQNLSAELDWTVNLAWAEGKNQDTGQALTSISPLQGNILVNYSWNNWQFSNAIRVAKGMTDVPQDSEGNDLIRSNGFAVWDMYATYYGDNWQLNAGVENLFDKEYVRYENIAGLAADADTEQFSETGRAFNVRLSYQF
ncbi:TonB-dependent hemoglobin/transferrin/lactoferrin family receptor [Planctobacterium marinum]|uniref:Ligand-gated channel protein n=1 Tax=Planctobacterium marinum TaxID=1631968 RepID=A0AA48HF83_9ALTE|nr:ligand-gated channel protein [Planctobacterium marinum]